MPENVAAALRAQDLLRTFGPRAPATVRRRLSSWSTLYHWKGVAGPFASGGRRRSEVASLGVEQLVEEQPVAESPADPDAPRLPVDSSGPHQDRRGHEDACVLLVGRPAAALREWVARADIAKGRSSGRSTNGAGSTIPR